MQGKALLLLFSTLLATSAAAGDTKPEPVCHQLMTERECENHQTQLATLATHDALQSYLAEFESIRKERERYCNCKDVPVGWTRMPHQRQAMLLY